MSFSSDLWNGFDVLKSNFLKSFNKLKNFYEIMFSFASLEKNYTINLEILYEQYQNLFNSDEIFLFPSKTFISNIKVECEYHKLYYNNIFDNILSPLKNIIESKKKLIIKNFCDNIKNSESYEKVLHNLISNQENYHNACKELALCMKDINIYTLNLEEKKKQVTNKLLINKRDQMLEKIFRSQIDYLNILTESNVILKDYNTKTENILNNLEKEFTDIGECIKNCLLNFSNNKIQLFHDVLEILNQSKNSCYEKINVKNNIKDFVMKNATKQFKFQEFEYIPFHINQINKPLLFSDLKENSKNPINQEKVIEMVKNYFIENKITETDSKYISSTINSLKKHSIEFNIKYNSFLENEETDKKEENKNLISEFISNEINQSNNINNNENQSEIFENINYIENFMSKILTGEKELDNDLITIKTLLQNNEKMIYLEQIIDNLNNCRKHGNYILNDATYDYLLNIFNIILEIFGDNDKILKNIVTFSQTFYKIKEGKTIPKYFILYSICNNPIFNKAETWHKIINNSLGILIQKKDLTENIEKNEKEKKLNENAFNIIVESLSIMHLFMVNDEIYNEVKNYYINVYKIDGENLKKEVKRFYEENEFSINKENENQLIKGENKKILISNRNNNEIKVNENINLENKNEEINENK